jgi:hypothetical protein
VSPSQQPVQFVESHFAGGPASGGGVATHVIALPTCSQLDPVAHVPQLSVFPHRS